MTLVRAIAEAIDEIRRVLARRTGPPQAEYEAAEGVVTMQPRDADTPALSPLEAAMQAQNVPLVRSPAEADALREFMRRPPVKRSLPAPLPLDE
jgi:hypothetical protein